MTISASDGYTEGVISEWDDKKAFGFITAGTCLVFFHITDMASRQPRPRQGARVIFQVRQDARKRICAAGIYFAPDQKKPFDFWLPVRGLSRCYPAGFALFFVWLYCFRSIALAIAGTICCNSLLALLFFRADKGSANAGARRIPEFVLHAWEFAGGWPGALLAIFCFHHKSRKISFLLVSFLIALIHSGLIFLLLYRLQK